MITIRRMLAALAAVAVLGACGSTVSQQQQQAAARRAGGLDVGGATAGDDASAVDAGATAGAGVASGTVPGAAGARPSGRAGGSAGSAASVAAKGPIEIGIVRTGTSNAAAFGASLGNTVTESSVDDALIAAINDKGGIAGRRLVPVYADTDTASTSWSSDFEAACAKFTQDHHVVAVLGYVFTHIDGFEQCLAKRGVPHLSTTFNVPDAQVLAQYPLLLALATPRIERRSLEKVDGALATGVLTKGSRLGAVIDSCPGTGRAWTKVTRPYLESKGVVIASVFEVGCADGSGDTGAEAGRAGNLVLQFRTANVDTVSVMSVSEGPPVLILANAAEAQGWHPKYVVSSLANASILAGQIPNGQAANVHGYGWMPVMDVSPDAWPSTPPAAQRCIAMAKAKGLNLTAPADFAYAFNLCDALFVYEAALKATSGRTEGPAVVGAVEALGSSFSGALTLEGRLTFGPTRHDAPSFARYFSWEATCSCFRYRSYSFDFD